MSNNNFYSPFAKHWLLDDKIMFLNHGSFGACPRPVLEKQNEYREHFEEEPVAFVVRELDELIFHSKNVLSRFIGCNSSDLALLPNVTYAVNTVFRSLKFEKGDEILITNHIYGACRVLVNFIAQQTGAVIKEVDIEFPIENAGIITDKILEALTPKTKIVFIDHITSPSAIIFPVKDIVQKLEERGIDCFIDGAHAPGSIPLNIKEINPAYYAGNCHKWICAPKGIGFLFVRKDKQDGIHPLALSHFSASGRPFADRFHWSGTIDPTAAICVADALVFMASLFPGGWQELKDFNHQNAVKARKIICDKLGVSIPCPEDMIASMAAIPFGETSGTLCQGYNEIDFLQEELYQKHHIEVPVYTWPDKRKRIIRPSFQVYNTIDQYKFLADRLISLR